jgi:hypothetical protein
MILEGDDGYGQAIRKRLSSSDEMSSSMKLLCDTIPIRVVLSWRSRMRVGVGETYLSQKMLGEYTHFSMQNDLSTLAIRLRPVLQSHMYQNESGIYQAISSI